MRFRLRDYAFPLEVLACRRLMRETPGWSPERLEVWARARRRAVVEHARERVPYYRSELGRRGIRPGTADEDAGWERIPTLTKEGVLAHLTELVADGAGGTNGLWAETSGSTGLRLRILLDRHVNAAAFAVFWRAWASGGHYRLGQRHAAMKGLFHPRGWNYNRAIRTLELASVSLSPETALLFRDLILRYRPRFMRGYPSAMVVFCRLLREQGKPLSLPMIISGSETLHDFQRTEIEGFLGARLYNHYTHWERAASILECEAGRLHAQEDYGHHEILDGEGRPCAPCETGEITVTSLHNRAMPLIRYRTGDLAAWSKEGCSCGQPFPVVDRIEGRRQDYFVMPDGRVVTSNAATAGMDDLQRVLYTQTLQWAPDRIEVRIVPAADCPREEIAYTVRNDLAARLGTGIDVEVRFCALDELERSPAGKVRNYQNRIPGNVPPGSVSRAAGAEGSNAGPS